MLFGRPKSVRVIAWLTAACGLTLGTIANANATLVGHDVFGVLNLGGDPTNFFEPGNTGLSQGALNEFNNPVPITDGVLEFSYVVNAVLGVFANFESNSLIIFNDAVVTPLGPWTMSLTSAAFTGLNFSEVSNTFAPGDFSASLLGDTIMLSWAGTDTPALARAEFHLQAVPLPASLPLFGAGLIATGFLRRRTRRLHQTPG